MLRQTWLRRCAAVAAPAASTTSLEPLSTRAEKLYAWAKRGGVTYDPLLLQPTEAQSRGLIARCAISEGTTVMSVPLDNFGLSALQLLQNNPALTARSPPSLDEVRHTMLSRSIQDPVMYEQVHLALLLAAERLNSTSRFTTYFETLPHPAINDAEAIRLHKDVLDPLLLVEWDDYQKEMLAVLHILLRRWRGRGKEEAVPPIELAYWALRTVMSRMHMLPKAGLAPEALGSHLSYTALSSVDRANAQTRWSKRIASIIGSLMGKADAAEEYNLVPTLVPVLDMTPHVPSSNVQVEVTRREGVGSCAELRAIREIDAGEQVGMRFNTTQSPAFLLFRFGFIPQ